MDNGREPQDDAARRAAVDRNGDQCSFFTKLPHEIRQQIYACILPAQAAIDVNHVSSKGTIMKQVSKQCYQESKIAFFKTHKFFVRMSLRPGKITRDSALRLDTPQFFYNTSAENLAALRCVWVYFQAMKVMIKIRLLPASQATIDQCRQPRQVKVLMTVLKGRADGVAGDNARLEITRFVLALKRDHAPHTLLTTRAQWLALLDCVKRMA